MQKGKLIRMLKDLSSAEFKQFGWFVHSPFFNRHKDTILLFDALATGNPKFGVADEDLYQNIFAGKAYDSKHQRVLKTYLIRLLYEFLEQIHYQKKGLVRNQNQAESLIAKGYHKEAQQKLDAGLKDLESKSILSQNERGIQYAAQEANIDLYFKEKNRVGTADFPALFSSLDSFYLGNRLKYLCSVVALGINAPNPYPDQNIRFTLLACETLGLVTDPIIGLYYHLLQMLIGENQLDHYPVLLNLLEEHELQIERSELVNLYGFAQIYVNRQYHSGDESYLQEMFKLYKKMVDLKLLFEYRVFSAHNFRNIVTIGARLKENEWTHSFIESHAPFLEADLRPTLEAYCRAYLLFSNHDYSASLKALQKVSFIDPYYRTGHQVLLLRIYYETESIEAFFALVASFRRYLGRSKKISSAHKLGSQNFIQLVNSLMRFRLKPGKETVLKSLEIKIREANPLTDRTWLLEKLEELKDFSGN